jgi:hypothetical protein
MTLVDLWIHVTKSTISIQNRDLISDREWFHIVNLIQQKIHRKTWEPLWYCVPVQSNLSISSDYTDALNLTGYRLQVKSKSSILGTRLCETHPAACQRHHPWGTCTPSRPQDCDSWWVLCRENITFPAILWRSGRSRRLHSGPFGSPLIWLSAMKNCSFRDDLPDLPDDD